MPMATAATLGIDAWCAVAALGRLVGLADVLGELVVGELPRRRDVGAVHAVRVGGGMGDPGSSHARLTLRCCALAASMKLLIVGRQQLACVLRRDVAPDTQRRPHRSLADATPVPSQRVQARSAPNVGPLRRRDVLGGLIHEYACVAA
jgi:hypothetical protein